MKAHELAKKLLEVPDIPVVINGWGSDEGLGPFEVSFIDPPDEEDFYKPSSRPGLIRPEITTRSQCIRLQY